MIRPSPSSGCATFALDDEDLKVLLILTVKPNPETARTPEAEIREQSLLEADEAIYSDGIEKDYLAFNSGMQASIGVAHKCGHLVV